jgi:CheY-like chemotaxis protein
MTSEAVSAQQSSGIVVPSAAARVLVIDDSLTILKVVSIILSKHGYDVATARDGAEGFERLGEGAPFDLVLLDFVMPRMNGYQFCRQLRADADQRHLPVVLMSARTNTIGDRFVEQTGAVDALSKPFDARALVAVVGNVLSKRVAPEDRPSMPTPESMVAEEELSVDLTPAGPPSQHFRSLGQMSSVIVDAIAPTIASMRQQDIQVAELLENHIAKCLTPQLLIELAVTAADLELEDEGSKEIMRGDMAMMPLAELLQMLQLRRQTGVMVARHKTRKVTARFYLRNGMLDFGEAEGLDDEFRLGRYFVEPGWITREALDKTLDERPMGKLMGEWLLEKELVTDAQLDHALARQSCELMYEALRWDEGRFVLYDDAFSSAAERAKLELGLTELVLEGFRRVDEWRLMADTIKFDAVLVVDQVALGTLDDSKIGLSERSVLMAIDGKRTAREVMEESDLASFDAIKSIYGFLQSRIVREVTGARRTESVTKMQAVSDGDVAEMVAETEASQEFATVAPPDEDDMLEDEPTSMSDPISGETESGSTS